MPFLVNVPRHAASTHAWILSRLRLHYIVCGNLVQPASGVRGRRGSPCIQIYKPREISILGLSTQVGCASFVGIAINTKSSKLTSSVSAIPPIQSSVEPSAGFLYDVTQLYGDLYERVDFLTLSGIKLLKQVEESEKILRMTLG